MRDIFVEGASDYALFNWFVGHLDCHDVSVHEIQTIDVPKEELDAAGGGGNRGSLILLAKALEDSLPNDISPVFCIIDADLDRVLARLQQYRFVRYTDFVCLEMYAAENEILRKVFQLYFQKEYSDEFLTQISAAAKDLFLVRAAKESLVRDAAWVHFRRSCEIDGEEVNFDYHDLVKKILTRAGQIDLKDRFITKVEELRALAPRDVRHGMHGHDFVELICMFVRSLGVREKLCDPEHLRRVLYLSLDWDVVVRCPLFEGIRVWAEEN